MKTIGLIGGMSWESTTEYYRIINQTVRAKRGGLHSAQCVLWSFDFHRIEALQLRKEWAEAGQHLIEAAQAVQRAGADFFVICTNTMHMVADDVAAAVDIPLLHIADATGERIKAAGLHKVGLLGTRYTMEEDFYKGLLTERHGLEVVVPNEADRQTVHRVIYNELCLGCVNEESWELYRAIMQRMVIAGAEGIILGCTEIGLLVNQSDCPVPLFDTTTIHAEAAAELALV